MDVCVCVWCVLCVMCVCLCALCALWCVCVCVVFCCGCSDSWDTCCFRFSWCFNVLATLTALTWTILGSVWTFSIGTHRNTSTQSKATRSKAKHNGQRRHSEQNGDGMGRGVLDDHDAWIMSSACLYHMPQSVCHMPLMSCPCPCPCACPSPCMSMPMSMPTMPTMPMSMSLPVRPPLFRLPPFLVCVCCLCLCVVLVFVFFSFLLFPLCCVVSFVVVCVDPSTLVCPRHLYDISWFYLITVWSLLGAAVAIITCIAACFAIKLAK